jgi:hypothetical protein
VSCYGFGEPKLSENVSWKLGFAPSMPTGSAAEGCSVSVRLMTNPAPTSISA